MTENGTPNTFLSGNENEMKEFLLFFSCVIILRNLIIYSVIILFLEACCHDLIAVLCGILTDKSEFTILKL